MRNDCEPPLRPTASRADEHGAAGTSSADSVDAEGVSRENYSGANGSANEKLDVPMHLPLSKSSAGSRTGGIPSHRRG